MPQESFSPSPTHVPPVQSTFRCQVRKGGLTATPDVAPTYMIFSLITEQLLDHHEIDRDDVSNQEAAPVEPCDPVSEGGDEATEEAEEAEESQSDSDTRSLPPPGPLKGYEYIPFKPHPET